MFRYTQARGIAISSDLWPEYTLLMMTLVGICTEMIHRFVERPMIVRGRKIAEGIMSQQQAVGGGKSLVSDSRTS
jgi:hypothetical protein